MQWLIDVFQKLFDFIYKIYASIRDILFDIPLWLYDELFKLGNFILTMLFDLFKPLDMSQYMTTLPPEVSWVFSMVGLPQCLGIIATAIAIRLVLQLIPFTRLGS